MNESTHAIRVRELEEENKTLREQSSILKMDLVVAHCAGRGLADALSHFREYMGGNGYHAGQIVMKCSSVLESVKSLKTLSDFTETELDLFESVISSSISELERLSLRCGEIREICEDKWTNTISEEVREIFKYFEENASRIQILVYVLLAYADEVHCDPQRWRRYANRIEDLISGTSPVCELSVELGDYIDWIGEDLIF